MSRLGESNPQTYALRVLPSRNYQCSPGPYVHVARFTVHSTEHRATAVEATAEAPLRHATWLI